MRLQWRGDEYEFQVKHRSGGRDTLNRNSNIDAPIWGADTESVSVEDGARFEVQCIQLATDAGQYLEWLPHRDSALELFCRMVIRAASSQESEPYFICYFHNLEYDWLQLVKDNQALLAMAKVGVSPEQETKIATIGMFEVYLDKGSIFTGSAPSVRLKFRMLADKKRKGARTFTLFLFDTWCFFPSSLDKLGKDLHLSERKEERQEDIGLRDYRLEGDSDDKREFVYYAKQDALVTRLAGEKIRELHQLHGMTKIRPSAPSYAISVLYAELDPEQKIISGTGDEHAMQLILDTYRGGRTGGIYHGAVDWCTVLDFHSSYPASMCSLPSFSADMAYIWLEDLSLEAVLEVLEETGNAFLLVSGTETDSRYPSLLTTVKGKLTPVCGRFEKIATTGYEFYAGVKSGGLTDIVIHECLVLVDIDPDVPLPFKEFAETGYQEKASSEKGSLTYIASKLKLNSAYGKLIESRAQNLLGLLEEKFLVPYLPSMEKEFAAYYYKAYVDYLTEPEGRDAFTWFMDTCDEVESMFDDVEEWEYIDLEQMNFGGRVYGSYVVPGAASLITGCSRARLLCAIKAAEAVYWDTDSIFIIEEMTVEEIAKRLEVTKDWLPENAIPITIGPDLGQMDIEMMAGRGYLAGTKRYYLEDAEGDKKIATHGVPALDKREARDLLAALATGSDYEYTSRGKPTKAKEAKTADEIGRFTQKKYRPQFQLDERLNWQEAPGGWRATVKPYKNLIQEEQQEQEQEQAERDRLLSRFVTNS